MGGTNETTINSLRLHVNNGNVHIHDDNKSLKFECSGASFKSQCADALTTLAAEDGIFRLTGSKDDMLLIKDGKKFNLCLIADKDMKSELESFIKTI
jgi:hypothetical protein